MTLTEEHITFENACREMFVGQTIRGVVYGELKYFTDQNGHNINPEPFYKTKYPDVDTLDHSIYFKTHQLTIYVYWDSTFVCYGLISKLLDLTETTNEYEQKWDVSSEQKWLDLIGQKIIDFKIVWEEVWSSNFETTNANSTAYPQTFLITTDNGETIVLSASEFKGDEQIEIYPLMDNLLVTTNTDLARQLKIIE